MLNFDPIAWGLGLELSSTVLSVPSLSGLEQDEPIHQSFKTILADSDRCGNGIPRQFCDCSSE